MEMGDTENKTNKEDMGVEGIPTAGYGSTADYIFLEKSPYLDHSHEPIRSSLSRERGISR